MNYLDNLTITWQSHPLFSLTAWHSLSCLTYFRICSSWRDVPHGMRKNSSFHHSFWWPIPSWTLSFLLLQWAFSCHWRQLFLAKQIGPRLFHQEIDTSAAQSWPLTTRILALVPISVLVFFKRRSPPVNKRCSLGPQMSKFSGFMSLDYWLSTFQRSPDGMKSL